MYKLKILDIINQLIAVDEVDWTNPREEHIRNLTPISNVSVGPSPPHDPKFSFYVGKETPKASKFSFDDMMTVIISEELYPLYLKLNEVAFIAKFNQIIYSHISKKLEEARERNVLDKDNIWMQPNTAFINWFHENDVEIETVKSFKDIPDVVPSEIEDSKDALWAIADDLRERKGKMNYFDKSKNNQFKIKPVLYRCILRQV